MSILIEDTNQDQQHEIENLLLDFSEALPFWQHDQLNLGTVWIYNVCRM